MLLQGKKFQQIPAQGLLQRTSVQLNPIHRLLQEIKIK